MLECPQTNSNCDGYPLSEPNNVHSLSPDFLFDNFNQLYSVGFSKKFNDNKQQSIQEGILSQQLSQSLLGAFRMHLGEDPENDESSGIGSERIGFNGLSKKPPQQRQQQIQAQKRQKQRLSSSTQQQLGQKQSNQLLQQMQRQHSCETNNSSSYCGCNNNLKLGTGVEVAQPPPESKASSTSKNNKAGSIISRDAGDKKSGGSNDRNPPQSQHQFFQTMASENSSSQRVIGDCGSDYRGDCIKPKFPHSFLADQPFSSQIPKKENSSTWGNVKTDSDQRYMDYQVGRKRARTQQYRFEDFLGNNALLQQQHQFWLHQVRSRSIEQKGAQLYYDTESNPIYIQQQPKLKEQLAFKQKKTHQKSRRRSRQWQEDISKLELDQIKIPIQQQREMQLQQQHPYYNISQLQQIPHQLGSKGQKQIKILNQQQKQSVIAACQLEYGSGGGSENSNHKNNKKNGFTDRVIPTYNAKFIGDIKRKEEKKVMKNIQNYWDKENIPPQLPMSQWCGNQQQQQGIFEAAYQNLQKRIEKISLNVKNSKEGYLKQIKDEFKDLKLASKSQLRFKESGLAIAPHHDHCQNNNNSRKSLAVEAKGPHLNNQKNINQNFWDVKSGPVFSADCLDSGNKNIFQQVLSKIVIQ